MKKVGGSFRHWTWDPLLLVAQIAAVQSALYASLAISMAIVQDVADAARSLDHLFEYREIHVRDVEGRLVIVAFVLNAALGGLALWLIVQRTKLCLDFSCTFYAIHLVGCWYYNGSFPSTFSWWALNVACAAVMCVTGEFLCLKTELKAIPLSMGSKVDL